MIVSQHTETMAPGKTLLRYVIEGKTIQGATQVIIPVVTVVGSQGHGPCLLFTSGVHGDEYEGPYALHRLIRELDAADIAGTVIIAPNVNPAALRARTRRSPDDDIDLNRAFPGDAHGTITEAIAAFMTSTLLPQADVVIDLHAGGDDCSLVPGPLGHFIDDPERLRKTIALMQAFGAPCGLLIDEENAETMWDYQVEQAGKVFFTAETGSAAQLSLETMEITWRGVNNAMIHLGIKGDDLLAYKPWRHWTEQKLLVANAKHSLIPKPQNGFFTPSICPGTTVKQFDTLGHILSLDSPQSELHQVKSTTDGVVFALSSGGCVDDRSWWVIVAKEMPWTTSIEDLNAERYR